MRKIKGRRPSPAMVVAVSALVVAFLGTAIAAPLVTTSVLNKQDKKKVKKIAANQINNRAGGLSVASAQTANTAAIATNANNANALSNVALADLVPVAQGTDVLCNPDGPAGTFDDCTGVTFTTQRTADLFMLVTGTWNGQNAAVQADCRIERNGAATSNTNELGEDTGIFDGDQNAGYSISELDANLAAGTYTIVLSCNETVGDFQLEDVETTLFVLGS
jgi:hypothetical protein